MNPVFIPLISLAASTLVVLPLWLILYKPWVKPKVGEIWKYQADDPFESPIIYKVLDHKGKYLKLEVMEDVYPFNKGYITTRSLVGIVSNIKKVG